MLDKTLEDAIKRVIEVNTEVMLAYSKINDRSVEKKVQEKISFFMEKHLNHIERLTFLLQEVQKKESKTGVIH